MLLVATMLLTAAIGRSSFATRPCIRPAISYRAHIVVAAHEVAAATLKPYRRTVMVRSENGVPEVAQCHPEMYETLLGEKVSTFQSMLAEAAGDTTLSNARQYRWQKQNFRMRASFKMWREDADVHYVMYNKQEEGSGPPHQVLSYPMGSLQINALMPRLIDELTRVDELRFKINDVRFLTTQRATRSSRSRTTGRLRRRSGRPPRMELARAERKQRQQQRRRWRCGEDCWAVAKDQDADRRRGDGVRRSPSQMAAASAITRRRRARSRSRMPRSASRCLGGRMRRQRALKTATYVSCIAAMDALRSLWRPTFGE